ncbi:sirohydrochlorin chelatase [Pseudogemmobacter humi]|uniref:sirohydrochlorin chelatase n=1 Tax=Pseudogemmobacter humi TaxID=2483812 RepID=UPI001F1A4BA8|nr:CbiX/SirB N-terminal domain-containing protein [Pseudogemmobacter humi]
MDQGERAKSALILAHGQPSDPDPAARELEALAALVAAHLPGWDLRAATLAQPGALSRVGGDMAPGLVFPVFMAAGWFTRVAVPARMAEAGLEGWRMLEPMGCAGPVQDLAVRIVRESGADQVLVAAHGSGGRSPAPAAVARGVAERIGREAGVARAEAAFIEQAPWLNQVSGWDAGAVCLPFFAMSGGHVTHDLPEALREAGFPGRILPALGLHPEIPALIAGLIREGAGLAATPPGR